LPAPEGIPEEIAAAFGLGPAPRAPANVGLNRFAWNMRYPSTFQVPRGAVLWPPGGGPGPRVVPGKYQVKVTIGQWTQTQSFEVKPDPRLSATTAEYQEQLKTAREVGSRIKDLYEALAELRDARQQAQQIGDRLERAGFGDEAAKAARAMVDHFSEIEGDITQLQGESGGQDALSYPGKLDNQWITLYNHIVQSDR